MACLFIFIVFYKKDIKKNEEFERGEKIDFLIFLILDQIINGFGSLPVRNGFYGLH